MTHKAYCYGMLAPSTLLLLDRPYPAANGYAEVNQTLENLAGEALAGAWVLQRLGVHTKLDGRWLADSSRSIELLQRLDQHGIDVSRLRIKPEYHPVEETVIADGKTRTVFGAYCHILFTECQWNFPEETDIAESDVVLLDPFLGEASKRCAEHCVKHNVPYLTCDVEPSNYMAQSAFATIISEEFLLREGNKILGEHPHTNPDDLYRAIFELYASTCAGWVIFTFGGETLWYMEPESVMTHGTNREIAEWKPFQIELRDSTGAGDSFRAGFASALLEGKTGLEAIRHAAAIAGIVCERFPGVLQSPTHQELVDFLARHTES